MFLYCNHEINFHEITSKLIKKTKIRADDMAFKLNINDLDD